MQRFDDCVIQISRRRTKHIPASLVLAADVPSRTRCRIDRSAPLSAVLCDEIIVSSVSQNGSLFSALTLPNIYHFSQYYYYFRKFLAILRIAGSSWPLHYLYSGVPARGNAQPKSPLCGVTKVANNTNLRGPHVARQQQLSIDICCPRPNTAANPPGRRCCCRSIGQMDGRTDVLRTDACRIYYSDCIKTQVAVTALDQFSQFRVRLRLRVSRSVQ